MSIKILQVILICLCIVTQTSCSFNRISNRLTADYLENKIEQLNSESDLKKVQQQLPKNIESLEKLIATNKQNKEFHIYAAQAYYSYAFSFIEDNDKKYAVSLYRHAYYNAKAALASHGVSDSDLQGSSTHLRQKIRSLSVDATGALYWTALSWAKIIEIGQPDLMLFFQLNKTAILMKQVIKLDDSYHYYGPYLFFAVYHAALPSYLGGNNALAKKYFKHARRQNDSRLLIIDYLQAKYLNGCSKKEAYTQRVQSIIDTPVEIYPEQALMNAVAKQKILNLKAPKSSYNYCMIYTLKATLTSEIFDLMERIKTLRWI